MKTFLFAVCAVLFNSFTMASESLTIGDKIPSLQASQLLSDSRSEPIALEQFRGKVLVLEFWATWCAPCVASFDHVEKTAGSFNPEQIQVLSITDEEASKVSRFARNKKIPGTTVLDPTRALFKAFSIKSIPATVIVDKTGTLLAVTHPLEVTTDKLQAILQNKPVSFSRESDRVDTLPTESPALMAVTLRESRGKALYPMISLNDSRAEFRNASLATIVSKVWSFDLPRTQADPATPSMEYDLVVDGLKPSELAPIVSAVFESKLSVKVQKETNEVEVLLLQITPGIEPNLPVSASEKGFHFSSTPNQISGINVTMEQLAKKLTDKLGIVVLNETSLTGKYDIMMQMAMPPLYPEFITPGSKLQRRVGEGLATDEEIRQIKVNRDEIKKAVARDLGLTLAPSRRQMPVLKLVAIEP